MEIFESFSGKNCVLFFELEKDKIIFPSLWTLWKHPGMMPHFSTFADVVPKMANGADLMLPGVVINPELGMKAYNNGLIKKNDPLAVNLTKNKASVALGTAHMTSEDMYMSGRRGKALKILHCYGDHLWIHCGKNTLPDLGVPEHLSFAKGNIR